VAALNSEPDERKSLYQRNALKEAPLTDTGSVLATAASNDAGTASESQLTPAASTFLRTGTWPDLAQQSRLAQVKAQELRHGVERDVICLQLELGHPHGQRRDAAMNSHGPTGPERCSLAQFSRRLPARFSGLSWVVSLVHNSLADARDFI